MEVSYKKIEKEKTKIIFVPMTPKEKAIELVDKFYQTTPNEAWINEPLEIAEEYKAWNQSKQCALIAVDELISSHNKWDDYAQTNSEEYYYWQEVKQEIVELLFSTYN